MAELQIQMRDQVDPNPAVDLTRYKRGYVVMIQPDGGPWGEYDSIEVWVARGNAKAAWPGNTALIKIPGVSVEEVQYLLESLHDALELHPTTVIRRRNWKCDLNLLPQPVKNTLNKDFVYTATRAQFDAAVTYLGV